METEEQNHSKGILDLIQGKATSIFGHIFSFLTYKELLACMLTSRKMYAFCNSYLLRKLISEGFLDPEEILPGLKRQMLDVDLEEFEGEFDEEETKTHSTIRNQRQLTKQIQGLKSNNLSYDNIAQYLLEKQHTGMEETRYNVAYRTKYSRDVVLIDFDTRMWPSRPDYSMWSILELFQGQGIKSFSIEQHFVVYHFWNNDMCFIPETNIYDPEVPNKQIRHNVKKYFNHPNFLVYLTTEGKVYFVIQNPLWSPDNGEPCHIETVLNLSETHPVNDIESSSTFCLIILNKEKLEAYWENYFLTDKENLLQPSQKKSELEIYSFLLQSGNLANPKITKIVGVSENLANFTVGERKVYFTMSDGLVLYCDFSEKPHVPLEEDKFFALPFVPLEGRRIERIFSGFTYFYAIEKYQQKLLWENDDVRKWARENGFGEYDNILRYENVSGKQIAKANEVYLKNTLGITSEARQKQFREGILQAMDKPSLAHRLYGWGSNKFGQICLPASAQQPLTEIKLQLDETVANLACGRHTVVVVTTKGAIWINNGAASHELSMQQKDSLKNTKGKKTKKGNKKIEPEIEEQKETEKSDKSALLWSSKLMDGFELIKKYFPP